MIQVECIKSKRQDAFTIGKRYRLDCVLQYPQDKKPCWQIKKNNDYPLNAWATIEGYQNMLSIDETKENILKALNEYFENHYFECKFKLV